MLRQEWLEEKFDKTDALIRQCAGYELSGGSISNVIRRCALRLLAENRTKLTKPILIESIQKELYKEGRIL